MGHGDSSIDVLQQKTSPFSWWT